MPVLGDIMSRNLRTIGTEETLEDARKAMREHGIRHLLIVEPRTGKLVGLVSDRDLRKIVSPFAGSPQATERDNATLHVKIGAIMRKNLVTLSPNDEVKLAVEMCLQKKVSCLPIVDEDGRAIGIVTSDDLLRAFLKYL